MKYDITPITTPFVVRITVNCYLLKGQNTFVLIDTGKPGQRKKIDSVLEIEGCKPGKLKLIALTHGDSDHAGNARYFRDKYGAPIALHPGDIGMVENGDMFYGRKRPGFVIRSVFSVIFRLKPDNRFSPDIALADNQQLKEHGFEARVIELPGHSRGNVGFLTTNGDLFCGDLLGNLSTPQVWSLIDDKDAARASLDRLKKTPARTTYPGHGKPFPLKPFLASDPRVR